MSHFITGMEGSFSSTQCYLWRHCELIRYGSGDSPTPGTPSWHRGENSSLFLCCVIPVQLGTNWEEIFQIRPSRESLPWEDYPPFLYSDHRLPATERASGNRTEVSHAQQIWEIPLTTIQGEPCTPVLYASIAWIINMGNKPGVISWLVQILLLHMSDTFLSLV